MSETIYNKQTAKYLREQPTCYIFQNKVAEANYSTAFSVRYNEYHSSSHSYEDI